MARRRLRPGEHGKFTTKQISSKPTVWEARCYVCDYDGERRQASRRGPTKAKAEDNLKDSLKDREGLGGDINGDTRIEDVAERWLAEKQVQVDTGERAPNTLGTYTKVYSKHIKPGVGALALRDGNYTRMDKFIQSTRRNHGPAIAKTARTVLNGIWGYALRHSNGALTINPMREVARITSASKKARALTPVELRQWFQVIQNSDDCQSWDLPDFCLWLIATGVREGEALACSFLEVDFAEKQVQVDFNIVRIKGKGLRRMRTKTPAGARTLQLPDAAMAMLTRRYKILGDGPIFPSLTLPTRRGKQSTSPWRDPNKVCNYFRAARQLPGLEGFDWVTSHAFRKTVATTLEEAGLTARAVADQMGHSRVSITQDTYFGRKPTTEEHAAALQDLYTSIGGEG